MGLIMTRDRERDRGGGGETMMVKCSQNGDRFAQPLVVAFVLKVFGREKLGAKEDKRDNRRTKACLQGLSEKEVFRSHSTILYRQ